MKPVLKYPGSKARIAKWIAAHFPPHTHYLEPYFGSGAVFFNKPPAPHEVINDLSGDVVNLFRVIRERGEELAALIEMTPWAREEYELSYTACDEPVERARRFFVKVWQSHGSFAVAGRNTWSIGAVNSAGSRRNCGWTRLPDLLVPCIERLRFAHIAHEPALDLIVQYARADCLIYADPPYPQAIRKKHIYPIDEMTDADHAALLDALDAHPGPVVLSGYHCALYDERLAHWYTVERRTQAEKGNIRTEVLWLNDAARPQQMRLL